MSTHQEILDTSRVARRSKSVVVNGTGWLTSDILNEENLSKVFREDHPLQPFICSVVEFEKKVFESSNQEMAKLRKSLSWQQSYTTLNAELDSALAVIEKMNSDQPTTKTSELQHTLLFSYRIIDVLIFYGGGPFDIRCTHPKDPALPTCRQLKHWEQMSDIQDLLSFTGSVLGTSLAPLLVESQSSGISPHLRLLRQLSNVQSKKKSLKIIQNVLLASLALASVQAIPLSEVKESMINLPDAVQDAWAKEKEQLGPQELQQYTKLLDQFTFRGVRVPLQLALAISPLFLLVPFNLSSSHYSKRDLILAMTELGNDRPAHITDLEGKLWRAIFKIADGSTDVVVALTEFISSVPWQELQVPKNRAWFRPGEHSVSPDLTDVPMRDLEQPHDATPKPTVKDVETHGLRHTPEISKSIPYPSKQQKDSHSAHDIMMVDATQPNPDSLPSPQRNDTRPLGTKDMIQSSPTHSPLAESNLQDHNTSLKFPLREERGDSDGESEVDIEMRDATHPDCFSSLSPPEPNTKAPQLTLRQIQPGRTQRQTGPPREPSVSGNEEEAIFPTPRKSKRKCAVPQTTASNPSPRKRNKRQEKRNLGDLPGKKATVDSSPEEELEEQEVEELVEQKQEHKPRFFLLEGTRFYDKPWNDLDIDATPPKYKAGRTFTAYDAEGNPTCITPEHHDPMILAKITRIAEHVELSYQDSKPRHLSNEKEHSVFKVLSDAEYTSSSIQAVQDILSNSHIVITHREQSHLRFDEEGLRSLRGLRASVKIQDQSIICITSLIDANEMNGTLRQVLDCSRNPNGKILSTPLLPLTTEPAGKDKFSSDTTAWTETMDEPPFADEIHFPTGDTRWGHVSTRGAFEGFQLFGEGFGAYSDVHDGLRWWIVPRPSAEEPCRFFSTDLFLSDEFLENEMGNWELEAILLGAGTRLILRPNTPYAVLTVQHSLSKGGHFYATSTMVDSFVGKVHSFMLHDRISSPCYKSSKKLIRRMILFYYLALVKGEIEPEASAFQHAPHLRDMPSLLSLLGILSLGLLNTVLDPGSYTALFDTSSAEHTIEKVAYAELAGSGAEDRRQDAYVRGLCWLMLHWIEAKFKLLLPDGYVDCRKFIHSVLHMHFSSLDIYLRKRDGIFGPHINIVDLTSEILELKIVASLPRQSSLVDAIRQLTKEDRKNITLVGGSVELQASDTVDEKFANYSAADIVRMGRNVGDAICEGDVKSEIQTH